MMITSLFRRRRLFFWLLRAYVKKRKKTVLTFFLAGILFAVLLYFTTPFLANLVPHKTESIGIVGSYTIESLPIEIQNQMSLGLTRITENGEASSSASLYYTVSTDGKTYTFVLRDDLFWQDGKKFTASDVNYNFKDVQIAAQNEEEVIFSLKEPFAKFPTVLAQPLFRKGLVGLLGGGDLAGYGEYKVTDIHTSGPYIQSLTIEGTTPQTKRERKIYKFYANEEEAKIRFMLGEVDSIRNMVDPASFRDWKNVSISETIAYNQLVTLFYNTSIPTLSDKTIRQALSFAIPRDFPDEVKATSPITKKSWAYVAQSKYSYDLDAAKKLLGESEEATKSGQLALIITTTAQFKDLAERIKTEWEKLGIATAISVVEIIPSDPQVLLERFKIPNDPDQYILWHSTQSTNISRFSSPKIDKLLEDGRQITNQEERAQIYADFQKHLVEESPAAFLYYPTVYTVSRK